MIAKIRQEIVFTYYNEKIILLFRLDKNNVYVCRKFYTMTSDITILNMTANGIVSKKQYFDEYHIVYKNLNFTFSLKGYESFTNYILDLKDIVDEHKFNKDCGSHEIAIPTGNENFTLTLTDHELNELKDLFCLKRLKVNIIKRMEYGFSLN